MIDAAYDIRFPDRNRADAVWPGGCMSLCRQHACLGLLLLSWCSNVSGQDDLTDDVPNLALQWTSLERQRGVLESNWREQQPVLEQQLDLLEREREELSSFLEETETAQDEVEERRLELLERQSVLEQQQASLERQLESAMLQLQSLRRQLPPPIAADWDEQLPQLRAEFLTTSERLQVLLEMLGDLDDFNRRVSLHEETMTLADGEEHLVSEVYLGVAQGWYVTANGGYAGIGRPGPDGWQWQSSDEPEAIERVIAILERRRNVELAALPVELGDPR